MITDFLNAMYDIGMISYTSAGMESTAVVTDAGFDRLEHWLRLEGRAIVRHQGDPFTVMVDGVKFVKFLRGRQGLQVVDIAGPKPEEKSDESR